MNLKQLEAFVQVAEAGSFSKAADKLFLTQPTISAHIAALEKELNIRLFVRNTREVSLSKEGIDLYQYASQMVALEKKIEEKFANKEEEKKCITIAASTIPSQYLLPEILPYFNERYPQEQLKIIETDSSGVVSQIVSNIADIGFTGTVLEKKHCKYIPIYKDELVIITPNTAKYQKLQENTDQIDWILQESFIMREEGSGTRKEAEKMLENIGYDVTQLDVIASVENQEIIKKSVRQGMGISILSRLATQEEVDLGQMLAFSIPFIRQGRDINVVYNKNVQLSKSVRRFIKVVEEIYLNETIL